MVHFVHDLTMLVMFCCPPPQIPGADHAHSATIHPITHCSPMTHCFPHASLPTPCLTAHTRLLTHAPFSAIASLLTPCPTAHSRTHYSPHAPLLTPYPNGHLIPHCSPHAPMVTPGPTAHLIRHCSLHATGPSMACHWHYATISYMPWMFTTCHWSPHAIGGPFWHTVPIFVNAYKVPWQSSISHYLTWPSQSIRFTSFLCVLSISSYRPACYYPNCPCWSWYIYSLSFVCKYEVMLIK